MNWRPIQALTTGRCPVFRYTRQPSSEASVCVVPGGAHPSYAHGYSERDNDAYAAWDEISRDRERFAAWLDDLRAGRVGAAVEVSA